MTSVNSNLFRGILTAGVVGLVGCQDPGVTRAVFAKFAVGEVSPQAVPVAGSQRPGFDGVLTVNFSSLLKPRAVLATVSDVQSVVVRLVPVTGGQVITQTVDKAALTAGTVSCTFTGLQAGDYTVSMDAYDVNGAVIGSNKTAATVQSGLVATVNLALPLHPTVPLASPSSGGGGTAPSTGGLTANGTIVDGLQFPPAVAATEVARFHRDGIAYNEIAADAQGNVYIGAVSSHGILLKLNPDMTVGWETDIVTALPHTSSAKVIGPSQEVWWGGLKFSPTGTHQLTLPRSDAEFYHRMDVDSQGNVWRMEEQHPTYGCALVKYSPDGTLLLEIDLPETAKQFNGELAVGPGDAVWCVYVTSQSGAGAQTAVRFGADGQKQAEFSVDTKFNIAVDSQNNLWTNTSKYSPSGQPLLSITLSADLQGLTQIDDADNLWVHSFGRLLKLSPTGQPLASYLVPADERPNDYDLTGNHFLGDFRVLNQHEVAMVFNHNHPTTGMALTSVLKLQL